MNDLMAVLTLEATQRYSCLPEYRKAVAAFLQKHDVEFQAGPYTKRPSEIRFDIMQQIKRDARELLEEFHLPFHPASDVGFRARNFFEAYRAHFYSMKPQLEQCEERSQRGFYDLESESVLLVKDIYCEGDIAYDRGVLTDDECKRYKQFVEQCFRAEHVVRGSMRSLK